MKVGCSGFDADFLLSATYKIYGSYRCGVLYGIIRGLDKLPPLPRGEAR